MAQPATNAKIEELRFKVKADPKSRLFFPLAEELRKAGQLAEAEHVLRVGLTTHATYLSAWVSLGRVLRDQKKDADAVEALNKALQVDPGNVVAARLLADAYLSLGDKVEAIKKYKLVYALMPADEELKEQIDALDRELNPVAAYPTAAPAAPAAEEESPWATGDSQPAEETSPFGEDTSTQAPMPTMETPFADALGAAEQEAAAEQATGDAEPMSAAHEESPFEDPSSDYSVAALTIEGPAGFHVGSSPLSAEVAAPVFGDEELPPIDAGFAAPEPPADESDVFAPTEPIAHPPDDLASTLTMADLYAAQGLTEDARQIYQSILARDPDNAAVAAKLAGLERAPEAAAAGPETEPELEAQPLSEPQPETGSSTKVQKLESWLARVSRREVGSV